MLSVQLPNSFDFEVTAGQGLTVSAKGIPIIRGSGFQYYAPGWTKGYYSSRWQPQTIRKVDDNTVDVRFDSGDASGQIFYRRVGNKLLVDYEFNWKSDDPALVELNEGLVWTVPFQGGTVTLENGTRTVPQLPPIGGLDKRALGKPSKETTLEGMAAKVTLTSSEPASSFDGRRYSQDWAEPAPVYWQGVLALPMQKGVSKKLHVEYAFEAKDQVKGAPKLISAPTTTVRNAVLPDESIPPLIPNPKMSLLDYGSTLTITNVWNLPAGRPKFFDLFRSELEKRFELPAPTSIAPKVTFDGGMSEFKKRDGAYHIKITKNSISVYGQFGSPSGLRNAMYRLAQMAFIRDGKVCLPTGSIQDEPRSDFRGVHLFVGPKALEFHQKLWNNVLRPLGLNKVVLQCERTDWKALPGVHQPITMAQEDLVKLFNWYRAQEVEPIPLIQSFGHMEWFFANGANRGFAVNPDNPYAIDPRKPGAKEAVGRIWDEAIQALKPKTIHVGLDEVDMIGFPKNDKSVVTEMWKDLLPYLGDFAKRHNVRLMLWGDKGLAPDEAVDATNGDDKDQSSQRRNAIPEGALIADWHYKADEDHVPFLKSLQLWKGEGLEPIASTWYRPENIRGFDVAADVESVGTLQTTWNGYESSEENMMRDLKQYSALVYAADMAWSARLEKISELPYDPLAVLAKMFNPHPSPLTPAEGQTVGNGQLFVCGDIQFAKLDDTSLSGIAANNLNSPDSMEVTLPGMAKEVAIALTCDVASPDSERVGEVLLKYKDGTQDKTVLQYGLHVRASDDEGAIFFGLRQNGRTCLRLPVKAKELKSIAFTASNRYSGLRVDGVTLIPIKGKPNR